MNTEKKFCQSCGMPLGDKSLLGTNKDGSLNEEYCKYCFENGDFSRNETMEEMAVSCAPFVAKDFGISEEEAKKKMMEILPTLKRWQ